MRFWHARSTVWLSICGCRLDRPGKSHFNARRVLAGVELVHKIIKGQFALPESFGTDLLHVWYNVLAA